MRIPGILSRLMFSRDGRHSLEPGEFTALMNRIRAVETILRYTVDEDIKAAKLGEMKMIFEKCVVSLVDIPVGTLLSADMLAVKKPGTGIPASRLKEIVGRRVARDIRKDVVLCEEDLSA